jgi:2-haloacid dehalogenase
MINTLFFDLNETLLDTQTLHTIFEESFDHPGAFPQWFTKMLFMSNTLGIVGEYKGFDTLAEEALNQVFMENRKLPSAPTKDLILSQFRQLSPHDDVIPALEWVKTKGLRCVAVSNSTQEMMHEQLQHAGLTDYFDNIYSVDAVQRAKPFPEIYQHAANKEGCTPEQIAMIASHDWDILGAKQAGFRTGYIFRKQMPLNPLYPTADAVGSELLGLVQQIITPKDA